MSNAAKTRAIAHLIQTSALVALLFAFGSQARAATTVADASPAPSPTPMKDTKLHAWVTPYLWLPTIHGQLNFTIPTTGGNVGLTVVPSQYTPKLASGALFTAGLQKGDWGVMTDLVYLNLTAVSDGITSITGPGGMLTIPIATSVQSRYTQTIWTTAATYNLAPGSPPQNFDALVGFRYANASPSVTWNFTGPEGLLGVSGSHKESINLWDGIVGLKGKFDLSKDSKWYAPFYGDIGEGGAFTWQAFGGVGYGSPNGGSVVVGYRNLYYNMYNGGVLHNINLGGPLVGYTFRL